MTEKARKLTTWSFSSWEAYDQCPFKVKCKRIDGLKEPENKYMARGTKVHQCAQNFVERKQRTLANELISFSKQLKVLRSTKDTACEIEWGFTKKWEPCAWNDKKVWCRVKTDVTTSPKSKNPAGLHIIDYKTGKIYTEKHAKQGGLYALGGFLMFPEVEVITTQFWYVDHAHTTSETYHRAEVPEIKRVWEDRVRPMLNDTQFPAKPNQYCGTCHFRKANGGPCVF